MGRFRVWRHFDFVLLGVTILLTVFGLVMIYSANLGSLDPELKELWRRQAVLGAAGLALIFLLAAFPRDYQWLGDFSWLAYLGAVLLLVLSLLFGSSQIGDVRGWLDLGFIQFQPSFPAMILLVLSVGSTLSRPRRRQRRSSDAPLWGTPKTSMAEEVAGHPDFVNFATAAGMTLILAGLVFQQPDMATAAVMIVMWLAMLFASDFGSRYLVLTAAVGLGSLVPIWGLMAEYPYMRDRVFGFLDPGSNPDVSYQLEQASIAIGSGGLMGKGLFQGTQSQLRYLPVRHTDFIFSVLAEELGFVGGVLLLALYAVLLLRLIGTVLTLPDTYGRLLVIGVLAMILFQITVNVGMNLGVVPVAGLPLPFISYGPAALLTTMMGIGLVENVIMHHRRSEF